MDLLKLLADGELHSGEVIASRLGVTRAAVWKSLRKTADRYGLALESVRGTGYRLRSALELLDASTILSAMSEPGRRGLARLELYPQIDSTNAYLMRAAAAGAPSGCACLAEQQTAGRGRRGRSWVSPFGVNLYLSILWRYPLAPAALGGMSLAAGAVVARVLESFGARQLGLKWPNDVLWRRRKLAGLLLEVSGESQGPSCMVVGVGINVLMEPAQGDAIDQPWASLAQAAGQGPISRNLLAGRVLDALVVALEQYGREGLPPFLEAWRDLDVLSGESIALLLGEQVIQGRQMGISSDGALLLETPSGIRAFQAGEVSLRPQGRSGP